MAYHPSLVQKISAPRKDEEQVVKCDWHEIDTSFFHTSQQPSQEKHKRRKKKVQEMIEGTMKVVVFFFNENFVTSC